MDVLDSLLNRAKLFIKMQQGGICSRSPVEMRDIVRAIGTSTSAEGAHTAREEIAPAKLRRRLCPILPPLNLHTTSTWVRDSNPQQQGFPAEDEPVDDDTPSGRRSPSPPHSEPRSSSTRWERSEGGGVNRTSARGIECLSAPLWFIGAGVAVIAVGVMMIASKPVVACMHVPEAVIAAVEAAEAAVEAAAKEDDDMLSNRIFTPDMQQQQHGGYSPSTVYSAGSAAAASLITGLVRWYLKTVGQPLV